MLSEAQRRALAKAPKDWDTLNIATLTNGPNPNKTLDALLDKGMVRVRTVGDNSVPGDFQWRLTEAGRRALAEKEERDGSL